MSVLGSSELERGFFTKCMQQCWKTTFKNSIQLRSYCHSTVCTLKVAILSQAPAKISQREVSEAAGRTLAEGKRRRKPIREWIFLRFVLFRYLFLIQIKLVSPFLHQELFEKVCAGSWYVYFKQKTVYLIQFEKCCCKRAFKSNQRAPCGNYRNPMLSTICQSTY